MVLEVVAAAVAAGVLALYLTVIGRSIGSALLVTGILILILFISFDLDRPRRGFINVPTTALVLERASMDGPPAATGAVSAPAQLSSACVRYGLATTCSSQAIRRTGSPD